MEKEGGEGKGDGKVRLTREVIPLPECDLAFLRSFLLLLCPRLRNLHQRKKVFSAFLYSLRFRTQHKSKTKHLGKAGKRRL